MSLRLLSLVVVAALSSPAVAAAEWMVSPCVGARVGGSTNYVVGRGGTEANKLTFGSSVGFLTAGVLGVEGEVAFVPGFFDEDLVVSSLVTTVMGNALFAAPLNVTQYGLRPYVTVGAGLLRARGEGNAPLGTLISNDLFGMQVGGGAIGPISPRSSVRFDLRYIRNLSGDPEVNTADNKDLKLSFWRASVGLAFRF